MLPSCGSARDVDQRCTGCRSTSGGTAAARRPGPSAQRCPTDEHLHAVVRIDQPDLVVAGRSRQIRHVQLQSVVAGAPGRRRGARRRRTYAGAARWPGPPAAVGRRRRRCEHRGRAGPRRSTAAAVGGAPPWPPHAGQRRLRRRAACQRRGAAAGVPPGRPGAAGAAAVSGRQARVGGPRSGHDALPDVLRRRRAGRAGPGSPRRARRRGAASSISARHCGAACPGGRSRPSSAVALTERQKDQPLGIQMLHRPPPIVRLRLAMPRRMWLLTVPSGRPVTAAICGWVRSS